MRKGQDEIEQDEAREMRLVMRWSWLALQESNGDEERQKRHMNLCRHKGR